MASVCCAALVSLCVTEANCTITVKQALKRCGPTCRGAGMLPERGPQGCEGVMYQPHSGGAVETCPLNSTLLLNFRGNPTFGGTNANGVCKGPVCAAMYGRVTKIHPEKNRPVRVRAFEEPGQGNQQLLTVVQFKRNEIPPHSDVKGPLTIRCTKHSSRITVGAGTDLTDVRITNCSATCPLHVKFSRKTGKAHTRISGVKLQRHITHADVLREAELCALLITPVAPRNNPRDFIGRGKTTFTTSYGHNVAIANVNGELNVQNSNSNSPVVITLLDSIEDADGRLKITPDSGPAVVVHNYTAIMNVFSQEYLIGFFGPSQTKTRELKTITSVNWALATVLLSLFLTGSFRQP